jgi:hydrogenase expression/formation protein HypE
VSECCVRGEMVLQALQVGKLPMEILRTLLDRYGGQDDRLVVGPRIGEDAAVLDMGDRYLVLKSDPITFATEEIGWYLVHVNANDIATMGAQPRWLLMTLLLPEQRADQAMVEDIFAQVSQACESLGAVLCGGHTEITYGLQRPIAVGLMLGEVDKSGLVETSGAQVGDHVILTKGIAIEGTAVLAREMRQRLLERIDSVLVDRGRLFLKDPGISVVRDARIICGVARPHAMHDPTEGGLATGLWEMAQAANVGIRIDGSTIYRFPETSAYCEALGLDPLGLLASGALVASAAPRDAAAMVAALAQANIRAAVIGEVVAGPPRVELWEEDGEVLLPAFARDELARLFD